MVRSLSQRSSICRWKIKGRYRLALHGNPTSELRDVTCHMGSHSVACHPTQVIAPRLTPSHAGWCSIYLTRRDGRLSWPIVDLIAPRPGVEPATFRSRVQRSTNAPPRQLNTGVWMSGSRLSRWVNKQLKEQVCLLWRDDADDVSLRFNAEHAAVMSLLTAHASN